MALRKASAPSTLLLQAGTPNRGESLGDDYRAGIYVGFVYRLALQSPRLGSLQGPATKYNRRPQAHIEFLCPSNGFSLPPLGQYLLGLHVNVKGFPWSSRYFPALCPDSSEKPPAPIRVLVLLCDYLKGSAVMGLRGVHGLLSPGLGPLGHRPTFIFFGQKTGRTAKDNVVWEVSLLEG